MVGSHLTKHLTGRGYNVIILTRKLPASNYADPNISYALWNVANHTIDTSVFKKANYIIHLAGAGVVDRKWTKKYKAEIVNSRTQSSAFIIETLQNSAHSVEAVISASAIGWYGEDPAPGKNGFTESDQPTRDFLGETCRLWEDSIKPVEKMGIRLIKLRTGIVLSDKGGALAEFKKPVKFGVAGILGNGNQMVSWIHIDDLCRMYIEAIENPQLSGSYNAVAPAPVSNKILTLTLAKMLKGSFFIPVNIPTFILRLMLGKRSIEVLKSTTVSCEKIKLAGFTFVYPSIESALSQLTTKQQH